MMRSNRHSSCIISIFNLNFLKIKPLSIILLLCYLSIVHAEPYELAKCELQAIRLGSEISDVFNSLIGGEDWDIRVNQDFIAKHLGFAPWLKGIHNSGGLTYTKNSAKDLQSAGGWIGKNIEDSPYNILNHKWIYMYGDSTVRQVWSSYAAPFQGNHFERNAKEWSRQYCNKQEHRTKHVKWGFFPHEGWGGPCGVNEVTCHVAGYGDGGLLSFDWKHFPYEDYDDWLFGPSGPWINGFSGEGSRRPDVLTIQTGMHSCWHASPQGYYSKHLQTFNHSMVDQHVKDLKKLFSTIRNATVIANNKIDNKNNRGTKAVIVVTSGATGMPNGTEMDECILKFNRAAADAAHAHGFAVLERGEIERRLMYKSLHTENGFLEVNMHLTQPAQNIIATCLLDMITCLNGTSMAKDLLSEVSFNAVSTKQVRRSPPARPLHVPPPG